MTLQGIRRGHIAYHFFDAHVAFVGDTLFALGCGRLFEGTPAQMWNSLQKIMRWDDEDIDLLRSRIYTGKRAICYIN